MRQKILVLLLPLVFTPLTAFAIFYPPTSDGLSAEEKRGLRSVVIRAEDELLASLDETFRDLPPHERLMAGLVAQEALERAVWFNYRFSNGFIPEAELPSALYQVVDQFTHWFYAEIKASQIQYGNPRSINTEDVALKAAILFEHILVAAERNLPPAKQDSLRLSLEQTWVLWAKDHSAKLPKLIRRERDLALTEAAIESPFYSWSFVATSVAALLVTHHMGFSEVGLWAMAGSFAVFFEGFMRNIERKFEQSSYGRAGFEAKLLRETLLRIEKENCESYLVHPEKILRSGRLKLVK